MIAVWSTAVIAIYFMHACNMRWRGGQIQEVAEISQPQKLKVALSLQSSCLQQTQEHNLALC